MPEVSGETDLVFCPLPPSCPSLPSHPPPFFLEIAASSIWLVQMPGAASEQTNRNGPIAEMNLSAWCLFSFSVALPHLLDWGLDIKVSHPAWLCSSQASGGPAWEKAARQWKLLEAGESDQPRPQSERSRREALCA